MFKKIYIYPKFLYRLYSKEIGSLTLVGKKVLRPGQLTSEEIKSLLWTAFEIKTLATNPSESLKHIEGANVTMLMAEPSVQLQSVVTNSARIMKVNLTTIIDDKWESTRFVSDVGKIVGTTTDLVLCQSKTQRKMQAFATGLDDKPLINIQTCRFVIPRACADLMTMQDKYGYLSSLDVTWIGSPCPLLNTYLCILPRFGMNLRYCTATNDIGGMSPMYLPVGVALSECKHTKLVESNDLKEALKLSNVIVTSGRSSPDKKVTLSIIEQTVTSKWAILHCMPRGEDEIDESVFAHKNCLVWPAIENLKWVYCALMLRLLKEYNHVTPIPKFEND